MRVYIAGICGTFMGGVARIATELGHTVGGCDAAAYPPMSEQLESSRIDMDIGYEPAYIKTGWDRVLIGNALFRGNPLVEEILRRRLAYMSGPEWLAHEALHRSRVLAVAGTHGKTTTAAMLAWILDCAKVAPGFLIGGVPVNLGVSARAGGARSSWFVIEADEYDTAFFDKRPKFMHYRPQVLVVKNLEFDHADIYETLDAIKLQFHFLLRTVPPDGVVLHRGDDTALQEVLDRGVWSKRESFSVRGTSGDADWFGEPFAGGFQLFYRGRHRGECRWSMPGEHNVANAVGAVAAAFHAGIEVAFALRALTDFKGVRRRLEVRSDSCGITVYDDFAHHPSAIRASLEAVAEGCKGRVFAVFEPHSNTMRRGRHGASLAQAFVGADKVFCYRSPDLADALEPTFAALRELVAFSVLDDDGKLLAQLQSQLRAGDRVVFMSSGGFDNLPARLAHALREQQP